MKLFTCTVLFALAFVSPTLGQPWVGNPWDPAPNVQQDWMPWNWMDRFNANVNNSIANGANIHLIFYGDSIMEGWPGDIWGRAFAPLGAANYGIGGDGMQNVLWRMINGELNNLHPRLVVLKIGTNNIGSSTPAAIAQGITACVNELRSRVPTARVLLLGVLPRSNAAMTVLVEQINQIVSANENLNSVRFLNMITTFYAGNGQFFLELFGSATDPLHLSHLGYLRWEERMYSLFNEMWNSAPLP